jgi:rRNA maturation endonuclease Nob1
MFFFIGGIQPKTILVDRQARSCARCGHFDVYLKRVDHYVSLFFIPLFPIKRGSPFLMCENCKTVFNEHGYGVDVEQAVGKKSCPQCGRSIDADFTFCPYCGKALQKN